MSRGRERSPGTPVASRPLPDALLRVPAVRRRRLLPALRSHVRAARAVRVVGGRTPGRPVNGDATAAALAALTKEIRQLREVVADLNEWAKARFEPNPYPSDREDKDAEDS